MRRLSYLLKQAPALQALYMAFMDIKILQNSLPQTLTSQKYYKVNATRPLMLKLGQHVGMVQRQFLLLNATHISLDSAMAQHFQQIHAIALQISKILAQADKQFAQHVQVLEQMAARSVQALSTLESGEWNSLDVTKIQLLQNQRQKRIKLVADRASRIAKTRGAEFYQDYLADCDRLVESAHQCVKEVAAEQTRVDDMLHANPSIQGQSIVRDELYAKIYRDKQANELLEKQFAQATILLPPPPRMFHLKHEFLQLQQILEFQLPRLPDFQELYTLLGTIRSAMSHKRYASTVRKSYLLAERIFTNFEKLRLLATGFDFPFESSERYVIRFSRLLFHLSQENQSLGKFLNKFITYQYKQAMDRYNSFQLTGLHRADVFQSRILFDGDDLNCNDVGCIAFYCVSYLVIVGFRTQFTGKWDIMPEMRMCE